MWLAALGVLLLATIGVVVSSSRSTPPTPTATPVTTTLVAHGQVEPVQQARVGTLGGGVVQDLRASWGPRWRHRRRWRGSAGRLAPKW